MATYIPNATQTTEPVESRAVESAALEFRTLKTSITARIEDVQDGLDTEIVNRIAGDANLQTQNNAQDVRLTAIENALPFIGEGVVPGTVYVQRFSGTGVQTAFTLDVVPHAGNVVDIYVNGLYQNKNTFSVAGAVITFSEAPPAGTDNIEVQVTVTIALGETDASLVTYGATTVEAQLDAISAASGSSLVGFQQAGTGAVVRTAQDKMREWVSVKDFGGKHDSASIDSAIRVRAWGDSLTAGAGGAPYPAQLYALAPFAAVTNSGVGGETSTQIKARFDAGLDTIAWTQIIWAGRNNYSETETVLSDIAGMVAQIPHPRFLVLSVLNSSLEAKGSAGYNHFITIRDSLKEAYPANFWDVRGYLINSGLAAVGISPTSQDLVDIENDVVPSSLRSDHIHLNSDGYKAVALGLRARLYELFEIIPERKDLTSMALVDNRAGSRVLTQRVEIAGPPGNATSVRALSTSGNGLSVQIDGGFIPSAHNAYDLGAGELLEWRDGLFARRVRTPTYYVGANDTGGQIKLSGDSAAVQVNKEWSPYADNVQSLGRGSLRWSVVYAGTGTISTSDEREKQQVRDLSDAERAVAVRMKGLVRAFKFNDAVVQKGDNARIHFGVIAQEVKAAFEAEGLVAEDYAVLCYDERDEQQEIVETWDAEYDEDGNLIRESGNRIVQEHRPAGNRYGVRYEELLAFIIATL